MAYGLSNGPRDWWRHVTPKVTWGSTVGYPSDSLASCLVITSCHCVGADVKHVQSILMPAMYSMMQHVLQFIFISLCKWGHFMFDFFTARKLLMLVRLSAVLMCSANCTQFVLLCDDHFHDILWKFCYFCNLVTLYLCCWKSPTMSLQNTPSYPLIRLCYFCLFGLVASAAGSQWWSRC